MFIVSGLVIVGMCIAFACPEAFLSFVAYVVCLVCVLSFFLHFGFLESNEVIKNVFIGGVIFPFAVRLVNHICRRVA